MPLYEYRCADGHVTEVMHRVDDAPPVTCDSCGAPAARILSTPVIHTQFVFSASVKRRPGHRAPGSETQRA